VSRIAKLRRKSKQYCKEFCNAYELDPDLARENLEKLFEQASTKLRQTTIRMIENRIPDIKVKYD